MDFTSHDLQYYLLPARNPPPESLKLHDQVFSFWMESWSSELNKLGVSCSHLHDDFIRQDVISCICSGEHVAGVFLYSFFSLETLASRTFRYFVNNYPEEFFRRLGDMGVKRVMATQYMAVHPDWRGKKKPPVHISLMLAGLSNRVRDQYNMDAGIGPTRRDHRVTDLFYAFGGTCVMENVLNHNVPCDMIANIRGKTHSHISLDIRQVEESLWANRVDYVEKKNHPFRLVA